MVKLKLLGYESFDEYRASFFGTLAKTNRTYDYYVDWSKIRRKAQDIEDEIMLMNVLTKKPKEERKDKLIDLVTQYPRITEVIPIIIAIRDLEIMVFDDESFETKMFDFQQEQENIDEIVEFCVKSGILDLFDTIDNLFDYIFGVEVGLDTNARKNRSGKIFEKMVKDVLEDELKSMDELSITSQNVVKLKRRKYADFTIQKNSEPILAVEVNFYCGTGSKPIEVARSYIQLERKLNEEGIQFIWITDGPGWMKMKNPLEDSMMNMDYVLNLEMAKEKIGTILEEDPEIKADQESLF